MAQKQYFDARDVIKFLKKIVRWHERNGGEFALFWDNARIHKARIVK